MKKINIFKFLTGTFAITSFVAGAFLLNGCSKENLDGFVQDEIIISQGETIDLNEYYRGSVDSFVSMDENIVSVDSFSLTSLMTGTTNIYSVVEGIKSDYIGVYVRDHFSQPKNISVNENGLITWDPVFSYVNGERIDAQYKIIIDENEGEIVDTNSYQLGDKGQYTIKLQACETKYVDSSDIASKTIYYQSVEDITGLTFTADVAYNSMKGTLSWNKISNATYNVIVDNVLVEKNLKNNDAKTKNEVSLDFYKLEKDSVKVNIEAVDSSNKKLITSTESLTLTKLADPEIELTNGKIVWAEIEGATKYCVSYTSDDWKTVKNISTTDTSTYLEGVKEGKYDVSVQAIGGGSGINSKPVKLSSQINKLPACSVSYSLDQATKNCTLDISTTNNEVKDFNVFIKDKDGNVSTEKVSIASGNSVSITKNFNVGSYEIQVQAISDGDAIYSDLTEKVKIYVLDEAQNWKHSFDENGNSILTFDNIGDVELFEIEINSKTPLIFNRDSSDVTIGETRTVINLGKIDRGNYGLVDGESFDICLTAKRKEGNTNEYTIISTTKKTIQILSIVSGQDKDMGDLEGNVYSWDPVENAKYEINLYRTDDANYSIEGLDTLLHSEIADTKIENLKTGYYVIQIRSIGNGNDYWNSAKYYKDKFIVSEQLDSVKITDFGFDENNSDPEKSGYYIKLTTPAYLWDKYTNARSYELYVDSVEVSTGLIGNGESNEAEKEITYNFSKDYDFSTGSRTIKIIVTSLNPDLFKNSNESSLIVEKLSTPTEKDISLSGNNVLNIRKSGNQKTVIISKNEVQLKDGDDYLQEVDISEYTGGFDFKVYYSAYTTKENDSLTGYFTDSEVFTIKCIRDAIPSVAFNNGEITISHTGKAEKFNLEITIKTKDDPTGKTFYKTGVQKGTNLSLETICDSIDKECSNYYDNKKSVIIKAYSYIAEYPKEGADRYFYVPSINSTEENKGKVTIEITQLAKVSNLAYDKTNNNLTWSSANPDGTNYTIYMGTSGIGNVNVKVSESENIRYYSFNLDDQTQNILAGNSENFKIVASKENCFTSTDSNVVTIQRLNPISDITVSTNTTEEKVYYKWTLNAFDKNAVKNLVINENDVLTSVTQKELAEQTIKIKLISVDTLVDSKYYLDSEESVFTIKKCNDGDYSFITGNKIKKTDNTDWTNTSDISSSYIEWNKYVDNVVWTGEESDYKVDYIFYVYDSDDKIFGTNSVGTSNSIEISKLNLITVGSYKFNVYAYLEEFTVNAGDPKAYLSTYLSTNKIDIKKLASVKNITYSFVSAETLTYDDEMDKQVEVEVNWEHDDFTSETYYNIEFVNSSNTTLFSKVVKGEKTLTITKKMSELLNLNSIKITAYSQSDIYSLSTTQTITKHDTITAALYDDGELNVTNLSTGEKIIIKVEIGNGTNYTTLGNEVITKSSTPINLYKYFFNETTTNNELRVSVITCCTDKIDSNKENIIKTILNKGSYNIIGNRIYFQTTDTGVSCYVIFDNSINPTKLTNNISLYEISSKNTYYKYYANNASILGVDTKSTNYGGYMAQIPNGATSFKFYFTKSGSGNSMYNENDAYESLTVSTSTNTVSDIKMSMDTDNKIKGQIDSASGIYFEISNGLNIVFGYSATASEISIWDLEQYCKNKKLSIGTYNFNVRTVSSGEYSDEFKFEYIKKKNTVTNCEINDDMILQWTDSNTSFNGKYLLQWASGYKILNYDVKQFDISSVANGDVDLTIKQIYDIPYNNGTKTISPNGTVITVSDPYSAGKFSFTQNIKEITKEDTNLLLTFNDEIKDKSRYNILIEHNNKIYTLSKFEYGANHYELKLRYIDIIDCLGSDFSADINSIKIALVETGKIKSSSETVSIDLRINDQNSVVSQGKAGNMFDEYIIYTSDLSESAEKMVLKIMSGTDIIYDDVVDLESGYWCEFDNSINNGFYTTKEGKSNTAVQVIKISNILNDLDMPSGETYTIRFAPIHKDASDSIQIEWLEKPFTYNRLSEIDSVGLNGDGSKVTWIDDNVEDYLTNYLVNYAGGNSYTDKDTKELSYTEFSVGIKEDLAVYAVSSEPGILFSQSKVLEKLTKNHLISASNISLTNGVLSMLWGDGLTSDDTTALDTNQDETIDNIFKSGDFLKILQMYDYVKGKIDTETVNKIVEKVENCEFVVPFNFKLSTIKDEQFEIIFENKSTNGTQKIIVKALDMLQYIGDDNIAILEELDNGKLSNFKNILKNKEDYFKGLASEKILFDDIGEVLTGENINAGEYKLIMNQLGNTSRTALKSNDSIVKENAVVVSAPSISAGKIDIEVSGEVLTSRYYIDFEPLEDVDEYRLIIKKNGKFDKSLKIVKESEKWYLYYSTEAKFELSIDGTRIRIILNSVGNVNGINSVIAFDENVYKFSIMACENGDKFNSKTEDYKVAFLKQSAISIRNGEAKFAAASANGNVFTASVIYKKENEGYSITSAGRAGTMCSYVPSSNGKYDFVAFITRGEIDSDNFIIYVDTGISMIEDVYKLYNPSISVLNGAIQVTDNDKNNSLIIDTNYERKYTISNNKSSSSFTSEKVEGGINAIYTYYPGAGDYEGDYSSYKRSEKSAKIFYIQNNGGYGDLASSGTKPDETLGSVQLLKYSAPSSTMPIVFRSDKIELNASMVSSENEVKVNSAGDIEWDKIERTDISNGNVLVYKVTIEYWQNTLSGDQKVDTETKYTTNNTYKSNLLKYDSSETETYKYKFKIQAMYYSLTNQSNGSIKTIEGNTYYIVKDLKYTNGDKVLVSETFTTDLIERLTPVSNLAVKEGLIYWESNESNFEVYVSIDVYRNNLTKLSGTTSKDGNKYKFSPTTELTANQSYYLMVKAVDKKEEKLSSVENKYNNTRFIKLPNFEKDNLTIDEDLAKSKYTLDFSKYQEKITPINSNSQYFNLKLKLTLDKTKTQEIILYPRDMKIYVYVGNETNVDTDTRKFTIRNSISIEVTPIIAEGTLNVINADSTTMDLSLVNWTSYDSVEWDDTNKEFYWTYGKQFDKYVIEKGIQIYQLIDSFYSPIDLSYNISDVSDVSQTIANGETKVEVTISGAKYYVNAKDRKAIYKYGNISNIYFNVEIVTKEIINKNSYNEITRLYTDIPASEFNGMKGGSFQPIYSGKLVKCTVYAKFGTKNLCSAGIVYKEDLNLNMFSGGDGSSDNPYLISTKEDFENIKKVLSVPKYAKKYNEKIAKVNNNARTTESPVDKERNWIYFKQTSDITIEYEGILFNETFNGVYDGNGKSLTITATSESGNINLKENIYNTEYTMTSATALFKKIGEDGKISNLKLNVNFVNGTSDNTVFTGITITNNGTISNIECSSLTFEANSKNNEVIITSLIAIDNSGKIEDCVNKANINITSSQNASGKFAFAGICSTNKETLIGCGNEEDVVITGQTSIYISGVSLVNEKNIKFCYNKGKLQGQFNNNNKGCVSGIINYSKGESSTNLADISYCFNTGKIYGEKVGGICYDSTYTKMSYVFGYGDLNDEIKDRNKCNNTIIYTNNLSSISNSYTYSGCTTKFSTGGVAATTSFTAKSYQNGFYTVNLIYTDTYEIEMNLIKNT